MSSSKHGAPHPLFDPSSHYRACTHESVWSDGGVQSFQNYFLQLYKERLQLAWQGGKTPAEPQDWGYTPSVNQKVHQFLLRERQRAVSTRHRAAASVAITDRSKASDVMTPALVRFDLSQPWPTVKPEVLRSQRSLFTGIDTSAGPDRDVPANRFEIDVGGLPPRHRCLFLLLDVPRVERVAVALQQQTVEVTLGDEARIPPSLHGEQEVIQTIHQALAPERLQPAAEADWETHDAASRLCCELGQAPGLQGMSDDRGWFRMVVELGVPRPYLPLGAFLVCCVGPQEPTDLRKE